MKEFKVVVKTTYYHVQIVEAVSKKQAEHFAEKMYYDGCFQEDDNDGFMPPKIKCLGMVKENV